MKHRIKTITITQVNEKLLPTIWNIWYASSISKRTISRDPYSWLVGRESMFRRIPMRITNNFRDIEFQSIINDIYRQLYVNEQRYTRDGLMVNPVISLSSLLLRVQS